MLGRTHGLVDIVVRVLAQDHNLDIIKGACVECSAYNMCALCLTTNGCNVAVVRGIDAASERYNT